MENLTELLESNYLDEETIGLTVADENTKRTIRLIFCTIYIILFFIGAAGNGYVILMLLNILSVLSSKKASAQQRMSAFGTTHMFIYVLGLSIVDLLVIMHLPLLVFELIEGQWIFGMALCKLYWIGESVNKMLSSFLMCVLSWDRYMAVCSPITSIRFRNNTVALIVLFCCATSATLLLFPVLNNSKVVVVQHDTGMPIEEIKIRFPEVDIEKIEIVTKCSFDVESPEIFMFYTFTVGFCIPALLISYFYLRVILRLRASTNSVRKHSDSFTTSSSMARLNKVTHRVVAIVLFYFACWLPYWSLNLLLNFQILITSLPRHVLSFLFFIAHTLVCFNSAANPLLYALINRELRQQHNQALLKRRRSVHLDAQRVQSDKPSFIRDSPSDYFLSQRRHHSYHQSRNSESSTDSNVRMFAAFAERCRASLPQTTLSKSLIGLRAMMTFNGGRTPPASNRNSIKRQELRSNSFSQPSFSALTQITTKEDPSFIDENNSDPNSAGLPDISSTQIQKIQIFIQEFD